MRTAFQELIKSGNVSAVVEISFEPAVDNDSLERAGDSHARGDALPRGE